MLAFVGCPFGAGRIELSQVQSSRPTGAFACHDPPNAPTNRWIRAQGVVFIGRAQEKTSLFRTEKRHNADGRPYPWIVKATGVINHFYF